MLIYNACRFHGSINFSSKAQKTRNTSFHVFLMLSLLSLLGIYLCWLNGSHCIELFFALMYAKKTKAHGERARERERMNSLQELLQLFDIHGLYLLYFQWKVLCLFSGCYCCCHWLWFLFYSLPTYRSRRRYHAPKHHYIQLIVLCTMPIQFLIIKYKQRTPSTHTHTQTYTSNK